MTTQDAPRRMVQVEPLLDELEREELRLKIAGGYGEAAGIRYSIVRLLRHADGAEPSIESPEPAL